MPNVVNEKPLNLLNIGRGNTNERFYRAIKEVLANIQDENTSLKKREINIKVVVTPHKDRESADIGIWVTPKLEPTTPYQSQIILRQNLDGEVEAHESIRVPDEGPPAHAFSSPEMTGEPEETDLEGI